MPRNLSHVEKHNKLHDLSDSNGHFQKIMSISFNSHLKRQQIRSIYHIKTIFVRDSIVHLFRKFLVASYHTVIGWEKYLQPITLSVGILVVCLSCDFINVHGEVHESKSLCHLFYFYILLIRWQLFNNLCVNARNTGWYIKLFLHQLRQIIFLNDDLAVGWITYFNYYIWK